MQIIAEHTAKDGQYFRIVRRAGKFIVEYSSIRPYLNTWAVCDTEPQARKAANKCWTRHVKGDTMIGCGAPAI